MKTRQKIYKDAFELDSVELNALAEDLRTLATQKTFVQFAVGMPVEVAVAHKKLPMGTNGTITNINLTIRSLPQFVTYVGVNFGKYGRWTVLPGFVKPSVTST